MDSTNDSKAILIELTFCEKFLRISYMRHTFMIDAINDIERSAMVEHKLSGNRNIEEIIYNPGNVVIFGSHYIYNTK